MITVQVIGLDGVLTKLGSVPVKARARLEQAFQRIGWGLTRYVQTQKLKGQVLKQRSGRLSESIHPEFVNTPSMLRAVVGTNVIYGAAHEDGVHKEVQVKAHMRKGIPVKAHPMVMNLKARNYLKSSLKEYYTTSLGEIEKAVKESK